MRTIKLTFFLTIVALAGCAVDPTESTPSEAHPALDGAFDPARSYSDRIILLERVAKDHPYPFAGTRLAWPDQRDGIVMQTKWQLDSGRATRSDEDTLWGWWPNVNYTLSAWQAIILQDRGELDDIELVEYVDQERFGPSPDARAAALAYYDELDLVRVRAERGLLSEVQTRAAQERLQQLLWKFHSEALEDGLARNEDVLRELPLGERRFSTAWGYTAVEILTTINLPTSGELIGPMNELLLPRRILRDSDLDARLPSDLPQSQRIGATSLVLLDEFERASGDRVLETMKRLVSSTPDIGRRLGDAILAVLRGDNIIEILRAL